MNPIEDVFQKLTVTQSDDDDYTGEDGLLYCGKCHTPKQTRLENISFFGDRPLPVACQCRREQEEREKAEQERRRHDDRVASLRKVCFTDPAMYRWTFENDNGNCEQMKLARLYVDRFPEMEKENIGYLLWGAVGTGKSFFAGCIANALLEQEIPVRMTNFASILNDLNATFEGRNEYIDRLCKCRLLILDDFGMERGTEYSLEQVYNVIDARSRSGKPLIVTTNLTLSQLQNPIDTAHARIYDRVLNMCAPIRFIGESFRRKTAGEKLKMLRQIQEDIEG